MRYANADFKKIPEVIQKVILENVKEVENTISIVHKKKLQKQRS
jgi:hypothetical protein